jgi:hypothetical protein
LIKVLLISTLLFLTLNARENPFFPSDGEKDIVLTTNEDTSKEPLKRASISIPNQARILQKVTIEYKNLDGSIERKSIDLDNSIDWHSPIFISQNYPQTQIETKSEETIKSKVEPKTELKPSVKVLQPIKTETTCNDNVTLEYLSIFVSGKTLKLVTKHESIRNFLLADPHRIVIDFKSDAEVKNYIRKNIDSIFTEIRVGNHDKFYRVVVELDGHYKYNFKKISEGYLLELK